MESEPNSDISLTMWFLYWSLKARAEGRNEMLVRSHKSLGIIAWQEANFSEAMRWLKMAEDEQTRADGNWVGDVTANRKRLEGIILRPHDRVFCLGD